MRLKNKEDLGHVRSKICMKAVVVVCTLTTGLTVAYLPPPPPPPVKRNPQSLCSFWSWCRRTPPTLRLVSETAIPLTSHNVEVRRQTRRTILIEIQLYLSALIPWLGEPFLIRERYVTDTLCTVSCVRWVPDLSVPEPCGESWYQHVLFLSDCGMPVLQRAGARPFAVFFFLT